MSGWTRILIFNYSFLIESTWSFIFHHNQQVTSMVFFCWKREPNFPFSPFHPCSSVPSASSAYPSFTLLKCHLADVTTYFSRVIWAVSRRNKHRSLQFLHLLAHLADGGRHHLGLLRQHDPLHLLQLVRMTVIGQSINLLLKVRFAINQITNVYILNLKDTNVSSGSRMMQYPTPSFSSTARQVIRLLDFNSFTGFP